MRRVAEDADKDVLGRDVAVDDTCDDDGRDRNAPDDAREDVTRRGRESWGGNVPADKVVDHDGCEEVKDRVGNLEQGESLGPVFGLLELVDDGEEARVGSYSEQ